LIVEPFDLPYLSVTHRWYIEDKRMI